MRTFINHFIYTTDTRMQRASFLAGHMYGEKPNTPLIAHSAHLGSTFDNIDDRNSGYENMHQVPEWQIYTQTWQNFVAEVEQANLPAEYKQQLICNSVIFLKNVYAIETIASTNGLDEWNLDQVFNYRKLVCLLWAGFIASAAGNAKINFYELQQTDSNNISQFKFQDIFNNWSKYLLQYKDVAKLYHGAIPYQIACDLIGKESNKADKNIALGIGKNAHLSTADIIGMLIKELYQGVKTSKINYLEAFLLGGMPIYRFIAINFTKLAKGKKIPAQS